MRNGTQNLFACLEVHDGEITGMPSKTRKQLDFIRFLDQLEGEIPAAKAVIAILDNLSTHKTEKVDEWLTSALALSVHTQARILAQPGRDLLLDPAAAPDQAGSL